MIARVWWWMTRVEVVDEEDDAGPSSIEHIDGLAEEARNRW